MQGWNDWSEYPKEGIAEVGKTAPVIFCVIYPKITGFGNM